MVKNLNTIDRSERIRIGKHVPDEQAINTIIINASSNVVEASQEGFYVSPVRLNQSILSNAMCYDVITKEIVDSGKSINLQGVSETGNTTSETLQFTNNTTGFITTSNVGIANSSPTHALSVGGDAYVSGNLTVLGQTTSIRTENTTIKDAILELGENNTGDIDLGVLMTRPSSNVATVYLESTDEYAIGYTQNSATDTHVLIDTSNPIEMRVYGNITGDYITADGSNIANVVKYSDLSANVALLRTDIDSNTAALRTDLQSNITITESTLRSEMTANTNALRTDLQSNITITESTLRNEMTANTNALRTDLQSNITITESTLRNEMAANTNALRTDLQSNITITESTLRSEMAANTNALRTDLQSNITITESTLRSEMTANTNALRTDLQSNVTEVKNSLRGEMAGNTTALRNDLQSNITITESTLRSEMAANTVTLRNEIALKSNTNNPVFTGLITGDGGAISNISLQHVTEYGNSSDRTIELTNTLSLITTGNVGVNINNPQRTLHVGGEILADDDITGVDFYGDDATFTGGLTVSGDSLFYGNLEVRGNTTYLSTQNLLVEDPILALGANNTSSSLDTGLIVLVYQGDSNVAFGYRGASNEFIISHTLSSPDDSELIPDTSNVINVHVYGDITADGNIHSNYLFGNGSALTGISTVTTLEGIVDNGNVSSNTIQLTNADVGLVATGNIQANYFVGDGSRLTGITGGGGGGSSNLEDTVNIGNVSSNTIQLTNADVGLKATGNVEAARFIGDGSYLTGISTATSNLEGVMLNGNVTAQTLHIQNVVSLTTTGNVGIANINPIHNLDVGSNLWVEDTSSNILTVEGNILAHQITLDSIRVTTGQSLQYVTDYGNTTSNTVQFTNTATSFVTTANVGIANSSPIHTLDVGSNLWVEDTGSNVLYVNGNIHATDALSVGSNLYLEDTNSNVLVIDGNASINDTLFLGAVELDVVVGNTSSQTTQFTNSNLGAVLTGGIVINDGSYKCKHYAYSNVSVPTNFANVAMTFASNVFHAKITAQLTHGNEEVSTMILDVQGGTRDGTTSSLNIASGPGSVFGHNNTKPWSMSVSTTPTKVILEPSSTGTSAYGVDVYIEYKSSSTEGKLDSISIGADTVKSFVY